MGKLEFFTETVPTDHTWNPLHLEATDSIVIGGCCTHTFELPFPYEEVVESAKVVYKQGLEVKLVIPVRPAMVQTFNRKSVIYVYLPAEYTDVFEYNALDVKCQIEFTLHNGKRKFGDEYDLKVLKPLKSAANRLVITDVLLNGESIVDENGAADVDLSKVVTDMSENALFTLADGELAALIDEHCAALPGDRLTVADDIFEHTDVKVKCLFGEHEEQVRLVRNGERSMIGALMLRHGDSTYEIVLCLQNEFGGRIMTIRCATVN